MKERCLLIDGHSLMYRAFHALPPMDADGVMTNAVHGFLLMLLKTLEEYKPAFCTVAFDEHGPTFRHLQYAAYKEGRQPTPDDLRPQFPLIKEILCAMGIGVVSLEGYEADDLLGTLSLQCGHQGLEALLLSGDKDDLQLVDKNVSLIFTKKGISETILFTPDKVMEVYGISPAQVVDWKALMGDPSDNIPGVPGVGDKTAVKLLQEYGDLNRVLDNAVNIKGKLGEKLVQYRDQALLSQNLARINRASPVQLQLYECRLLHLKNGISTLRKYKLNGIIRQLEQLKGMEENTLISPPDAIQSKAFIELQNLNELQSFLSKTRGPLALHLDKRQLTLSDFAGEKLSSLLVQQEMLLMELNASIPVLSEALQLLFSHMKAHDQPLITNDAKALFHLSFLDEKALPELKFDTFIANYLLHPDNTNTLEGDQNAYTILRLSLELEAKLAQSGMSALFAQVELPLVRVLYAMEREGFQVDTKVLSALGLDFTQKIEELKQAIYDAAGVSPFNILSPQQLGNVLFNTLHLPTGRKNKSGYSTDADTLERLTEYHPVVQMILDYRQLTKLNSTYIDGLKRQMGYDGRIHSALNQTGTVTGRISSSEPNLQNIPVRTATGREIRRAFVAKKSCILIDADYSQIELRILAHMSGDEAMRSAFIHGEDIHALTAAQLNGVALHEVTGEMRSNAKAVNFGIIYGISDFGLARNIGISRKEAADFINRYFERFPKIHAFLQSTVQKAYEYGYAQTLFGRRRPLPELKSSNANTRNFGERAAMNTPIQGTAADIIKKAMVRVFQELESGKYRSKLIMQVHDELIIEAPVEEAESVCRLLKSAMEQIEQLEVPLSCEVKTGSSLYDSK